jgi:hypothetical protein
MMAEGTVGAPTCPLCSWRRLFRYFLAVAANLELGIMQETTTSSLPQKTCQEPWRILQNLMKNCECINSPSFVTLFFFLYLSEASLQLPESWFLPPLFTICPSTACFITINQGCQMELLSIWRDFLTAFPSARLMRQLGWFQCLNIIRQLWVLSVTLGKQIDISYNASFICLPIVWNIVPFSLQRQLLSYSLRTQERESIDENMFGIVFCIHRAANVWSLHVIARKLHLSDLSVGLGEKNKSHCRW